MDSKVMNWEKVFMSSRDIGLSCVQVILCHAVSSYTVFRSGAWPAF